MLFHGRDENRLEEKDNGCKGRRKGEQELGFSQTLQEKK